MQPLNYSAHNILTMTPTIKEVYTEAQANFKKATLACKKASIPIFDRAQELPANMLEGSTIFSNRLQLLQSLVLPESPTCIELGVDKGNFSLSILESLKPRQLVLTDLDLSKISDLNRQKLQESIQSGVVILHETTTLQSLSQHPDDYFDLIYIDANHSYRDVLSDLQLSHKKLSKTGFLVLNDYTVWSPSACCTNGVARAAHEFLISNGSYKIHSMALHPLFYNDLALCRK